MVNRSRKMSSERGATLVFVISAFLVISSIGMVLLKMSHHDLVASSDLSAASTADHAARSGIEATEAFFASNSASSITILQNYITTPKAYWVLGDTTIANRKSVGQTSYATELLSFAYETGSDDFTITVKSYGYGKSKSQKEIVSIIDLSGLGWAPAVAKNWGNVSAFHLADGLAVDGHFGLNVSGNVYLPGGGNINYDGYLDLNVGGILRVGTNVANPGTIKFSGSNNSIIVGEQAYFKAPLNFQTPGADGVFTFKKGVGFENSVNFFGNSTGMKFNCEGNVYRNGNWTVPWQGGDAVTGVGSTNELHYKSGTTANAMIAVSGFEQNIPAASIDIPSELGIDAGTCEIDFDLSKIMSKARNISDWPAVVGNVEDLDGSLATQIYNDIRAAEQDWHGFAVVRVNQNRRVVSTGSFNGKMILIIPNGVTLNGGTYFSTSNITDNCLLVIADNGGNVMDVAGYSQIRGGFISKPGGLLTLNGAQGFGTLKGLVQFQAGCRTIPNQTLAMNYKTAGNNNIIWDPTVLAQLDYEDFISQTGNCGNSSSGTTDVLELTAAAITPTLIGLQH